MSENVVYSTNTIQATAKTGKNKYWRCDVVEKDGTYYTRAAWWQDKGAGYSEVQTGELYEVKPTNVGKANERSGLEQAKFNADADYKKQLDKGYHLPGQASTVLPLPMLAHKYEERKHSLGPRICGQPKLDGCRALQKDGVFWSRLGKPFPAGVTDHLQINTEGMILDGELILPAPYTFQETMAAVKKDRDLSKKLQYWVFDIVDTELTFSERSAKLLDFINKNQNSDIILVPTYALSQEKEGSISWNEADVFNLHSQFIAQGYEGTIIRDCGAKYLVNHRSQFLLKLKTFEDAEFLIIDVKDGDGREKGCAIFVCKTKDGTYFDCRPKGTIEYRQNIYNNKDDYIGKMLTVKFFGYTDDGSIRFPVGIGVRDYE